MSSKILLQHSPLQPKQVAAGPRHPPASRLGAHPRQAHCQQAAAYPAAGDPGTSQPRLAWSAGHPHQLRGPPDDYRLGQGTGLAVDARLVRRVPASSIVDEPPPPRAIRPSPSITRPRPERTGPPAPLRARFRRDPRAMVGPVQGVITHSMGRRHPQQPSPRHGCAAAAAHLPGARLRPSSTAWWRAPATPSGCSMRWSGEIEHEYQHPLSTVDPLAGSPAQWRAALIVHDEED